MRDFWNSRSSVNQTADCPDSPRDGKNSMRQRAVEVMGKQVPENVL